MKQPITCHRKAQAGVVRAVNTRRTLKPWSTGWRELVKRLSYISEKTALEEGAA